MNIWMFAVYAMPRGKTAVTTPALESGQAFLELISFSTCQRDKPKDATKVWQLDTLHIANKSRHLIVQSQVMPISVPIPSAPNLKNYKLCWAQ